ncbi:hypothetical protein ACFLQR_01790, partial [Verrucomicrobiota bacterium]
MNPILAIEQLVLILAAVIAVGVVCAWRTSAKCRKPVRVCITGVRLLGLAVLAMIALNPGHWHEEREQRDNEWAVLADRSLSMSTADMKGKTRWDEACRIAAKAMSFAQEPEHVKVYTFAGSLEPVPQGDLSGLKPDGKSTDILQAGSMLLNRFRSGGRRLTGILLLSDGRQIEHDRHDDLALRARSQETPIFAVPLGGDVTKKDLSIKAARKQYVTFVGQRVRIAAFVANEGLGKISPQVRLFDSSEKELAARKVVMPGEGKVPVYFEVQPAKSGYYEYSVKVSKWEGESTHDNNQASFGIAVLAGKMRVLMIEGTLYWDTKFMAQLLRKQPNMAVISICRLSADRFFKVETDMSRVSDAQEAIFPDNIEALGAFDLIVFGKGVEYFLTPDRINLLREFVRDQGGAIVFSRGKPYSGSFPDLEPLEPVTWGEILEAKIRFQPLRAGEHVGLFGDLLPGPHDPVWSKLPPLQNAYRCAKLKAFTQTLAEGAFDMAGEQRSIPIVLSRRYGKGIIVLVNAEGLWQWDFFPHVAEAGNLYQELWTQLPQWAATYSEFLPGQEFSLKLSRSSVLPGTPVRARIYYRGRIEDVKAPMVSVMRGDTLIQELSPARSVGDENRWDTIFSLSEPGAYRVDLANTAGRDARGPCAALHVRTPTTEKDDLNADRPFLDRLARESGGRIIT